GDSETLETGTGNFSTSRLWRIFCWTSPIAGTAQRANSPATRCLSRMFDPLQTQKDGKAYHETRILPTGVMTGMELAQAMPRHMCVDLRGGQITVSEQHLHYPQVGPVIEQMGGKSMTQCMRRQRTAEDRKSTRLNSSHVKI